MQGVETAEGLHLPAAVTHYGRLRFILNLLSLIRAAPAGSLKRVVSVFTGTKEGGVMTEDLQGRKIPMGKLLQARGHGSSMATLALCRVAEGAPEVGFVHGFPG